VRSNVTDADFARACDTPTEAALWVALALFRRYNGRLLRARRELARRLERRDAHPRVPQGNLRDEREDGALRGYEVVVRAMRELNAVFAVVEEGAIQWAKEQEGLDWKAVQQARAEWVSEQT
jgi:hypothetical protein